MKKTLAILALVLFIGGIGAPVIAANNSNHALISLRDEDPKKKSTSENTEKKAETTGEATKSGDCSGEKKADCSGEKKAEGSSEKKADCSGK